MKHHLKHLTNNNFNKHLSLSLFYSASHTQILKLIGSLFCRSLITLNNQTISDHIISGPVVLEEQQDEAYWQQQADKNVLQHSPKDRTFYAEHCAWVRVDSLLEPSGHVVDVRGVHNSQTHALFARSRVL